MTPLEAKGLATMAKKTTTADAPLSRAEYEAKCAKDQEVLAHKQNAGQLAHWKHMLEQHEALKEKSPQPCGNVDGKFTVGATNGQKQAYDAGAHEQAQAAHDAAQASADWLKKNG